MDSFEHIYKGIDSQRGMLYAWFAAMHTRVDMAVCGRDEADLMAVAGKVQERIGQLEKLANFYDPDSELANLNDAVAGTKTEVSEELLAMIYLAMRYNELTDGNFDICIKSPGYTAGMAKDVEIDLAAGTLAKHRYGIRFDMSGFIKGYALDEARNILERYAVGDVLLSIGNSSILALGNHPFGEGWLVSYPGEGGENMEAALYGECLSTSGNATGDRRHIISPSSGKPVEGAGMASVATRTGAEGEALATAMFIEKDPAKRDAILCRFGGARLMADNQN